MLCLYTFYQRAGGSANEFLGLPAYGSRSKRLVVPETVPVSRPQHPRFTALIKVSDKEMATVVAALVDPLSRRSLLECFGSALSRPEMGARYPTVVA